MHKYKEETSFKYILVSHGRVAKGKDFKFQLEISRVIENPDLKFDQIYGS